MFVHAGLVLSIMVLAFIVAKGKSHNRVIHGQQLWPVLCFTPRGFPSDISLRVPLPTLTFA